MSSLQSSEDMAEARRALKEAESRLIGLTGSEKLQAYLMISNAWLEVARLQGQIDVALKMS